MSLAKGILRFIKFRVIKKTIQNQQDKTAGNDITAGIKRPRFQ